jgi:hypothetical protein
MRSDILIIREEQSEYPNLINTFVPNAFGLRHESTPTSAHQSKRLLISNDHVLRAHFDADSSSALVECRHAFIVSWGVSTYVPHTSVGLGPDVKMVL